MCGIAGKFFFSSNSINKDELKLMTDTIAHRGPDGEGFWLNENKNVGFGHRRLSIIDLSVSGNQPMHYNNLTITFNGEIYNYLEIKNTLEKKGYLFQSNSDTEVILAAYLEYGEDCLNHFDGMFAFAIWDEGKQELFAARDRFGEKPFYYFKDNDQFVFASEMKAIFASGIKKNVSHKMTFYYLVYDVVENSNDKSETFYQNIFQLPASHCLKISKNGDIKIRKYWNIDYEKTIQISEQDAIEQFISLFHESVKLRLRSDVPVGTSFSGGLDSSSIVASVLTQYPGINLNTFTCRFEDKNYDEGEFINYMLNKYSFTPHNTWPTENLIIDELDKIFYHQEEPFGGTSVIAQWEVKKLAKKNNITVLLDGQGADETLAGYFKYFLPYLSELYKSDRSKFNIQLNLINENLNVNNYLPKSFYLNNTFPKTIDFITNITRPFRIHKIANDLSNDYLNSYKKGESPFKRINNLNEFLHFDTFNYGLGKLLRFADRNSMAFSREVRLPFLSHKLVEFDFSLPKELKMNNGWTKYILRKSMENTIPKEICWRRDKKAFQAPEKWMENKEVKQLFNDAILFLQKEGIIDTPIAEKSWQYLMCYKLLQK